VTKPVEGVEGKKKLTDTAIKNAKPADKPKTLWDERGLYLLVTPAGGKLWRFKYRFEEKGKLLSFGVYPDVGLANARERRDEARRLLANGMTPARSGKRRSPPDRNGRRIRLKSWRGNGLAYGKVAYRKPYKCAP
jgi:hypothetical protein